MISIANYLVIAISKNVSAGQQGSFANYSLTARQSWLSELQHSGLIDKAADLRHVQSLSHAEGMALMQAIDRFGAGNLGKRLTINVDRKLCNFCKSDGGLMALKEYAGLKRLTIVDSMGRKTHF